MLGNKNVIAIVGYGGMGSQHGKLISSMSEILISGIYDIKASRQTIAKERGFNTYKSLEEVLEDKSVDIVLIATPNHIHREIAIKALRAGKNVICEKPVTLNSQELQDIMDVSEECNKLFVVHQNRRWDEDFRVIKKIYDEELLGEVYNIESRVQGSRGIPGDWRQQKEFGGGMMLDWGVHLIDRISIMIDEKIKKIYCKMTHIKNQEVDDGFQMHMIFESGKTALIEVGTANYINLPLWYLNAEKGTAVINGWDMTGKVVKLMTFEDKDATPIVAGAGLTKTMAPREGGSIIEEDIFRIESDVRDFYRNVIDTIAGKTEIIVKNSEVMRVMKIMEAAFKSDELGQVVDFE